MVSKITAEQLKLHGWLLEDVSEDERSYDLCKAAVQSAGRRFAHNESILRLIPAQFITNEICLEAVSANGEALRDVLQPQRTREVCLEAVRRYGWGLCDVPRRLRFDEEICWAAVRNDGRALSFVPNEIRTHAMLIHVVSSRPDWILHIPKHARTGQLNLRALRHHPELLDALSMEEQDRLQNGYSVNCPRVHKHFSPKEQSK